MGNRLSPQQILISCVPNISLSLRQVRGEIGGGWFNPIGIRRSDFHGFLGFVEISVFGQRADLTLPL